MKAWKKVPIDNDELCEATTRHARAWEEAHYEKRYIPHPATWLRREGWADELAQPLQAERRARPRTDLDDFLEARLVPVSQPDDDEPPF